MTSLRCIPPKKSLEFNFLDFSTSLIRADKIPNSALVDVKKPMFLKINPNNKC